MVRAGPFSRRDCTSWSSAGGGRIKPRRGGDTRKDACRDSTEVKRRSVLRQKIAGKRWIERPVDLATMPIYVRAGAIVPLDPVRQYTSQPVTEPSDIVVKMNPPRVTLAPGGTATIDVEVTRQNGYDKPVVLDVRLRHLGSVYGDPLPPGVTLDEGKSKTLLGPSETKGKIVLLMRRSSVA